MVITTLIPDQARAGSTGQLRYSGRTSISRKLKMASQAPRVSCEYSTCKRCKRSYDDPRMLPCLHSFCKTCIDGLVSKSGSSKVTVCCPTCHTSSPLSQGTVEELPKNAHLNYRSMLRRYASQIQGGTLPTCDECSRDPPEETVSFCCTCQSFLCKECHRQHVLSRKMALKVPFNCVGVSVRNG